jgi:hypothetical protein
MSPRNITVGTFIAALLALTACATSPEDAQRRMDMEADIDEILTYELDKTDFGEPRNCLRENEYRSYRPLGDRHLLFEGKNDKRWINILRGRCPSLGDNSFFVMELSSSGRVCDMDKFDVVDRMSQGMGMGSTCVLGEFKPAAKAQVHEIETRLEMR